MYSEYFESINSRNPFFIGTVVDNDDPTKNYRVKVRLPKIHDKIKDADLPWAARVDRAFRGIESKTPSSKGPSDNNESSTGGKEQGQEEESKKKKAPKFDHCVPEKGTKLLVLAIQNDVNSLVYMGALYKKTDYTPEDDEKYLGTYGIYANEDQFIGIDETGDENEIKVHFIGHIDVDKIKHAYVQAEEDIIVTTKKNIAIETTGEANILVLCKNGTLEVDCKNLTATVEEKAEIKCKELNAEAEEKATVKAKKIKLDGDVEITGKLEVKKSVKAEEEVTSGKIPLTAHMHPYTDDGSPSITGPSQVPS